MKKKIILYNESGTPSATVRDPMSGKIVPVRRAVIAHILANELNNDWPYFLDAAKAIEAALDGDVNQLVEWKRNDEW